MHIHTYTCQCAHSISLPSPIGGEGERLREQFIFYIFIDEWDIRGEIREVFDGIISKKKLRTSHNLVCAFPQSNNNHSPITQFQNGQR